MNLAIRIKNMLCSCGVPLLLLLGLWFALTGCSGDQNSTNDLALTTPQWVQRSPDNMLPQTGIRAEPVLRENYHFVRLEWRANPEPDILGYRIWRCPENARPTERYLVADLRLDVNLPRDASSFAWVDHGDSTNGEALDILAPVLNMSHGFYWEVQAYDTTQQKSPYSERIYYRLLNNPFDLVVLQDQGRIYQLSWNMISNNDAIIDYYFVRVFPSYWGLDSVGWYRQFPAYGTENTLQMDFTSSPMRVDCTYICQLNVISSGFGVDHTDSLSGSACYTQFVFRN